MTQYACDACANTQDNRTFSAHEMMFGTHDSFEYFECARCHALQIAVVPDNLGDYYPDNYYSFASMELPKSGGLKRALKRVRLQHALGHTSLLGSALVGLNGRPDLPDSFAHVPLHQDSRILDVGGGGGELLHHLYHEGFGNLTGVDPFVEQDIVFDQGVTIYKKTLSEMQGKFDLILFNHSFEHMNNSPEVLRDVTPLLAEGGHVVLAMPVAHCYAWEHYGVSWVQLDAPRHLVIHTTKSVELLAEQTGLKLVHNECISTTFQFLGSEIYARDIPLIDPETGENNSKARARSLFTTEELAAFETQAVELNASGKGDTGLFILSHGK
ncbi:MAG TPA: hypothetical protein DCR55_10460 [Lentisphaeria bacterium]|nr:hypothetical protein [Lentisphaeria bacterium]